MSERIARVEAIRVAAARDYQKTAGLRTPNLQITDAGVDRVLGANSLRHACTYPAEAQTLLVRIETESGVVGWGEAHSPPVPGVSLDLIDQLFEPQLIGEDPLSVEAHWDRLYHSMRLRGHNSGFMLEAMAGVDIALWDLAGKLLDQPIYKLMGGPFGNHPDGERMRVPCYASGVPGETVQERMAAADKFIEMGFTAMKSSVGRGTFEQDLRQVEVLKEHIGDRADLMVDAHGCYDARTVFPAARRMQDAGIAWLEDPLCPEDVELYGRLCQAFEMPIANGETEDTRWHFHEKLKAGAADVILPDICRAGGISEGRRIAWLADLYRVPWCVHASLGSHIHIVAGLHLALATPNFCICEFPNPIAHNGLGDPLMKSPLEWADGHIMLPEGPGLGLAMDEDAIDDRTVERR